MKGRHKPDRSAYYGKRVVAPSANMGGPGHQMSARAGAVRGNIKTGRAASLAPVEGMLRGERGRLGSANVRSGQWRRRR